MPAGTPIDIDKLRSIGVISKRSRPVIREGRRSDGVRVKVTETEIGKQIEHATKDDRVDAIVTPQTVTLTRQEARDAC